MYKPEKIYRKVYKESYENGVCCVTTVVLRKDKITVNSHFEKPNTYTEGKLYIIRK